MPSAGPLAGLRVVDLTAFQNGPSATVQMADNGADVVKVEPAAGDGMRFLSAPGEINNGFDVFNRGKRSVCVDLKHEDAVEVMRRLVAWADVLTENYRYAQLSCFRANPSEKLLRRPGVLERLGFGYDWCCEINPALIYASNSGFGDRGEWAQRPSFDAIAQSFAGAATAMGGGPSHEPRLIEWTFSDEVGAMHFYSSILAALFARSANGGKGQRVTTSQTGATLHFQRASVQRSLQSGTQRDDGLPSGSANGIGQKMHRAADGQFFAVSLGQRKFFERFVTDVLGAPGLLERPDDLEERVAAIVASRDRDHWVSLCADADVPCAPASSYADIGDTGTSVGRHVAANDYLVRHEHRDQAMGDMAVVPPPTRYSDTPHDPDYEHNEVEEQHRRRKGSWHAPDIGEHSAEVLSEIGFSDAEVERLTAAGGAVPPAAGSWARL